MLFFKHRNKTKTAPEDSLQANPESAKPFWCQSLPGQTYKDWPKKDGEPEEPAFLKHCTSVDMEDEMLINMLSAYGIPALKLYPSNGSFGKVVLGMSGDGADILVPSSMLEDAVALIGGSVDE